jgi:predicted ATP-grasp superfamily ATP-dependent carboligase
MPHEAATSFRDRVRERDAEVGRCGGSLCQQSVAGKAEALAEEVDARAVVGAADALAAGDVRELRMTAEVAARPDVDVNRIERHRRDLVGRLARGLGSVDDLRGPTEFADQRSSH